MEMILEGKESRRCKRTMLDDVKMKVVSVTSKGVGSKGKHASALGRNREKKKAARAGKGKHASAISVVSTERILDDAGKAAMPPNVLELVLPEIGVPTEAVPCSVNEEGLPAVADGEGQPLAAEGDGQPLVAEGDDLPPAAEGDDPSPAAEDEAVEQDGECKAGKQVESQDEEEADEPRVEEEPDGEDGANRDDTPADEDDEDDEGDRCESSHDEPDYPDDPVPSLSNKELGRKGELAARKFLERKGYEILDVNWTCFAGEADIVALDDDVLCFIEVKTRRGLKKGFPAEAVTHEKRARYEKIAACYLSDCGLTDTRVRFDVISIMVLSNDRAFLRMHTNAFSAESES